MDAGLAAVLGAAVGAIGASATALISGALGRSQTRLQLRAEGDRIVDEHRRSSYRDLFECTETTRAHLGEARSSLSQMFDDEAPVPGDQMAVADVLQERAVAAVSAAEEKLAGIPRVHAAVAIQGPEATQAAATALVEALRQELEHTKRWTVAVQDGWSDWDEYEKRAFEAHHSATAHSLAFACEASAALQRDGSRPEPRSRRWLRRSHRDRSR
ncbi:hypothetical protein AB0B50_27005 [Streptomyces sp. NPDC041068]|uniref:hypothetical protein n=1 Tax=Streptomyces sp. NPDC041068 TaxID=3155130 RepID=UPI0033F0421D